MTLDLQKASMWKRISAGIFDGLLTGTLAVLFALVLSALMGFDSYNHTVNEAYTKYETEYGITFNITQEEYLAMSDEDVRNYDAAYAALIADSEAMHAYNMVVNQILIITSIGILLSFLALEFAVPLWLKNGQTLGKKVFGIGLMRTDGVQLTALQLFLRTILGKYTVETMIPVFVVILIFFGTMGLTGTVILAALGLTQIILVCTTRTNSLLHDVMAGTVAVDFASQMIFRTTDDLIAYKKRIAAEQAARQTYY